MDDGSMDAAPRAGETNLGSFDRTTPPLPNFFGFLGSSLLRFEGQAREPPMRIVAKGGVRSQGGGSSR